jgi:hypothetical protein
MFCAFIDTKRLTIRSTDGTPTTIPPQVRQEMETSARALTEYMLLLGPGPDDLDELQRLGHRPDALLDRHERRVAHQQGLVDLLAKNPTTRLRLSDIVYARHIVWELLDFVKSIAPEFGMTPDEFFAQGKEWMIAFPTTYPAPPSRSRSWSANFRNSYKAMTGNDLYDADAMAAAIPYCDIVVTDKHVAAQLATSPAVTRLGTKVLARLQDLHDLIPALLAARAAT